MQLPSLGAALLTDATIEDDESPIHNSDGILNNYYLLVSRYSRRRLAFDSDKLPAFSGIAERPSSLIDGEYLAGL